MTAKVLHPLTINDGATSRDFIIDEEYPGSFYDPRVDKIYLDINNDATILVPISPDCFSIFFETIVEV